MRIFRDYLIGILLYCTGSQIGTCSHTPVDNLWSTISLFVLRRYITNHIGLFSFYAAAAAAQHFDIYQFLVKITTYFVFIFGNASTLFLMFAVICIMVSCHLGFSSNMPMWSCWRVKFELMLSSIGCKIYAMVLHQLFYSLKTICCWR